MNQYTGSYTEDIEGDGVRLNAFEHEDANVAYELYLGDGAWIA